MITKPVHAEHQVENAQVGEEKVELERRDMVRYVVIHFDATRSKTREPVMQQINSRKAVDNNVHCDMPVDWKKEMIKELAKLVL